MDDYPTDEPFFANPQNAVGRKLFDLSQRMPMAEWSGVLIAIVGGVALGATGANIGGPPGLILFVAAAVVFVAGSTVSEFGNRELCPDCEYCHKAAYHYCPSCGHDYGEWEFSVEEVGDE